MRVIPKYDLNELARRIQQTRRGIDPVSFQGFDIENVQSVLESGVEFRPEVSEYDRRGLVRKAIMEAAQTTPITAQVLEAALRKQEVAYLRQPLRHYVLATSLTISPELTPKSATIDGGLLRFSRQLPRAFARAVPVDALSEHITVKNPHRLASVRVAARARTHFAAFDIAREHIDYWRALLNFQLNARTAMRMSSGERRAVNQILPGPIHTLHKPTGALAVETFWYEAHHQQSEKLADVRSAMPRLIKTAALIRRRVRRCRYGSELRTQFVRYTRALDSVDYHVAFNGLWAVLEYLAGAVGEYKKLIDRVVFLYDTADAAFTRLLLEHLRDVRNGIVHESAEKSGMETYLYQLKTYAEDLFRYHLSAGNEFSSVSTATAFLDLPSDIALLRERIAILRRAHRFRSPRAVV